MKKSLLLWGALIVVALCFVGCCYYNTTHNHNPKCLKHCHHQPCCNESGKKCPDSQNDNGDDVETVTIEAMEIVPLGNGQQPVDNNGKQAPANTTPAANTAAPAPANSTPATAN